MNRVPIRLAHADGHIEKTVEVARLARQDCGWSKVSRDPPMLRIPLLALQPSPRAAPTVAAEKMNVLLHRLRRPDQQHPRLLRRPDAQDAEHRQARGARACGSTAPIASSRCAIRAGPASSPGLRPDTTKVYENAHAVPQERARRPDPAADVPEGGYFVARVGKLYHYGVPAQIGTDGLDDPPAWEQVVNPRGRDKDDEDRTSSSRSTPNSEGLGPLRRDAELARRRGRPTPNRPTARSPHEVVKLLEANKDRPFFIGLRLLPPAHALRRPEEVLRACIRRTRSRCRRCRRTTAKPRPAPAFGSAQEGTGRR